jgi:hypothetical protein
MYWLQLLPWREVNVYVTALISAVDHALALSCTTEAQKPVISPEPASSIPHFAVVPDMLRLDKQCQQPTCEVQTASIHNLFDVTTCLASLSKAWLRKSSTATNIAFTLSAQVCRVVAGDGVHGGDCSVLTTN